MILFLLACVAPDPADPAPSGPTDADGDGVFTPDDCDDADPDVFPGAPVDDLPGDGVDAECDGYDGPPYEGCAPILVPDVHATIEDALLAGETSICLGEGTFTPTGLPEGARGASAFKGQGRGRTFLVDPAAHYAVGVLDGLTARGLVATSGSLAWSDLTVEDATVTGFDNLSCDRCGFVRAPIALSVTERIAGVVMTSSWIAEADPAIHVVTDGCAQAASCSGYFVDVRLNGLTFTDNGTVFDLDLSGNYGVYLVLENTVFLDQETLLAVDVSSRGAEPSLATSAQASIAWGTTGENFPTDYDFNVRENDPELDRAFSPPRPLEGSPLVGAGSDDAASTDYWGVTRDDPDRGAVER
jgi:hypothetical protein